MKYSASKLTMTAVSILLLAGCSTTPVATNTNLNANVNVNNVSNEISNTNVVADENTNVAVDREVDTSDWQTYTNEEYGFSFKYPQLDGTVEYFKSSCDDQNCTEGSMLGWKHISQDGISSVIAGAASGNLSLEREYSSTDFSFFEKRNGVYFLNGTKEILVDKAGKINGQEYIIYPITALSPAIDQDLPGKAAMITIVSDESFDYPAITFYFSNPVSLQEIETVLSSLKFY